MTILILISLAFLEGYIEWRIYNNGYAGSGPKIFGWLRANYHIPLFLRWVTFCILLDAWWFLPAFASLEDIFWHVSARKFPTKDSWISRLGFWIVPNVWWIGLLTSGLLYAAQ